MKFIRIINNSKKCMQALFECSGEYFLYSYIDNKYANETMVFRAEENGEVTNWSEIEFHPKYLSTDDMMKRVEKMLNVNVEA